MRRILADTVAFGKQYIRSGVAMFFAFAFPILLILIFGAIFSGSGEMKLSLPVQNLDEGPYSQAYVQILENISVVDIEMIPTDQDIEDYIRNESLQNAILIPRDFSFEIGEYLVGNRSLMVNITLYSADPSSSTYATIQEVVYLSTVNLNYALAGATPVVGFTSTEPPGFDDLTFMDFFLPGVVGLVVMTNTLYTITSTCGEYKTRSYFKLLATTSLKKYEWLLSKFIFYTLLLFASLILTFAIGQAIFDMTSTLTPLAFVFIAAGGFLFLSMGMTVGIIVKDPESGAAVANAIGFPMMFLSGIFFDLETMPDYIQAISKAFPLTYFNDGLRDAMFGGNLESALFNLGIVVLIGLVFFVLASKLMSWKER
ncbi:MAG TPA: ABC transporter permease [Thermoplasmata archaeon]